MQLWPPERQRTRRELTSREYMGTKTVRLLQIVSLENASQGQSKAYSSKPWRRASDFAFQPLRISMTRESPSRIKVIGTNS